MLFHAFANGTLERDIHFSSHKNFATKIMAELKLFVLAYKLVMTDSHFAEMAEIKLLVEWFLAYAPSNSQNEGYDLIIRYCPIFIYRYARFVSLTCDDLTAGRILPTSIDMRLHNTVNG